MCSIPLLEIARQQFTMQITFELASWSSNCCLLFRGEKNGLLNFLSPYFFPCFSLHPNFSGRFSLLPDFSPFSQISLLRGLFYLLLYHSVSFPRVLRWLDTVFQGQYLPSLSINYFAINKVLEKLPPQLY